MALTMNPKRTDHQGRELIADQQLIHKVAQFTQLASELNRRLTTFTEQTSIRPTVLSSVVSAQRNCKAAMNHLRAAGVLADSDI
jgi:hypothetical protein